VQIVVAQNTPPVANAGSDQVVDLGLTVTFNGNQSADADNGPQALTYAWTIVSKPVASVLTTAAIQAASSVAASFVPDVAGTYVLSLTVSDGASASSDNVAVTVNAVSVHASGSAYFFHDGFQEKLALDVTVTSGTVVSGGWLKYYYARTRTDLSSTQILSMTVNGSSVVVTGMATINGVAGYRFVATVVDGAPDAFGIAITRPNGTLQYEYSKSTEGGDLQIVK
jgi:hypothetical protein